MKKLLLFASIATIAVSCNRNPEKIVDTAFADSLISHYSPSPMAMQNGQEMEFWKNRINPALPGFLNEGRYAGCLSGRFRLFGDIRDMQTADSVLQKINTDFNFKEPGPNLTMVTHCITEHQFTRADSFLQKAEQLGIKRYETLTSSFDVDFELGKYTEARIALSSMQSGNDYGYFFRKSKMDHLVGNLDSSINSMLKASVLASNNTYLRNAALSNAADLYIHDAKLVEANALYMQCLRENSTDFHSLMGIAWIAMVNDKNDMFAAKIYRFVQSKYKLPDPLFRLTQLAAASGNDSAEYRYASEFEQQASQPQYGPMYNKYLIQLNTGILKNPSRAEIIAAEELQNRATPQTYAWLVWSLTANNKLNEAYQVFQQHVSGKPLEGLELYWMGRMMEKLDKKYNAIEFYKAAYKNRYDLDPAIVHYIEQKLA